MSEGLAWVDGQVVDLSVARVPLLDRGHLLGDGVFETLHARAGRLLHRERHASRLERGLGLLRISSASAPAWKAVDALLAHPRLSTLTDVYVRLQVTTGLLDEFAGQPGPYAVTAMARPWRPYPPRAYADGLHLVLAKTPKAIGPFSSVKTTSFLPHVAAKRDALAQGADDAILLNDRGHVCEATTSNVFAVVDGDVHSPGPEEGAVDGVTRGLLLEGFQRENARVLGCLTRDELEGASEVFLTNTVAGVVPARAILDRKLTGPKGPVYTEARRLLREFDTPTLPSQARGS